MLEIVRTTRAYVAFVIAAVGSTVMYCNHLNRAVGEAELCNAVEKHVAELNTDLDGAIRNDAIGLVESIQDRCESSFSRKQARRILRARSMAEGRACRR